MSSVKIQYGVKKINKKKCGKHMQSVLISLFVGVVITSKFHILSESSGFYLLFKKISFFFYWHILCPKESSVLTASTAFHSNEALPCRLLQTSERLSRSMLEMHSKKDCTASEKNASHYFSFIARCFDSALKRRRIRELYSHKSTTISTKVLCPI